MNVRYRVELSQAERGELTAVFTSQPLFDAGPQFPLTRPPSQGRASNRPLETCCYTWLSHLALALASPTWLLQPARETSQRNHFREPTKPD